MAEIVVPETKPVPKEAKIPWWGWVFAAACGVIPILALGGAIPMGIGFGGVAGCLSASRLKGKETWVRVTICAVIAGVAWLLFIGLVVAALVIKANMEGAEQP